MTQKERVTLHFDDDVVALSVPVDEREPLAAAELLYRGLARKYEGGAGEHKGRRAPWHLAALELAQRYLASEAELSQATEAEARQVATLLALLPSPPPSKDS